MVKFLFAFLLLVHGLIHLMGFAKAFNYAEISQLTQPISRPAGVAWGLSALLFVVAAVLLILKKDSWWMWALPAVMLSQLLIFSSWQDAKFGTIANLIAVLGIAIGYGHWDFKKLTDSELKTFLSQPVQPASVVTEEKIATLPPIVQTWLRRSGVAGKPAISTVHLRQTGAMRTAPDGKWMPVNAEQYFTVQPPGFLWLANVKMMPFVHLSGRDKYMDGKGHMLIEALTLIPVADSKGPEIDQGTMLRYLGETVWFPSAALSSYITWDLSAKQENEKIRFHLLLALMWTTFFAALIFFNYICQTTFIRHLALHYQPEYDAIIATFSMANPMSLSWAVEMWGYGILGVATWLMSGYYAAKNRTIYWLLILNGVVSTGTVVFTIMDMNWLLSPTGLAGYLFWNVLMITLMMLIYRYYKKRVL